MPNCYLFACSIKVKFNTKNPTTRCGMRNGRQFHPTLVVFPKLYFLEREGKALAFC